MRLIEVDLRSKLERLDKVMENVDSFSNARADLVEIRALLINIQNELKKYEAEVIASSSYITAEVLDEEVKAYERRKRDSEIHIWQVVMNKEIIYLNGKCVVEDENRKRRVEDYTD